ncbi:MAG: hypothetical protein JWP61_1773 [Friedmanniella sp.]|nr:hypothetical protein [Friedmanniella sp.]
MSDNPYGRPGESPVEPYPPGSTAAGPVAPYGPGGLPVAYPPYPPAPTWYVPPSPLPTEPRLYHQMLRGPRFRWWRPLLALLLVVAIGVPLALLSFVSVVVGGLLTGVPDLLAYVSRVLTFENLGPVGFVALNLSLIVLIPAAGLSLWIAHRIRPRFIASVAGGIRWRWLLRCVVVVLPVWVVYLALGLVLDFTPSPRPAHWAVLLVIVLIMTPFQAAGEEYLFRGWIMQNIGAWFPRPLVGLVVTVVISTVAFSAAHGSPDPWVLGSIAQLAVAATILAWRTGGLEAGIVLHATNNILVFFTVILVGGWDTAFVGADTTSTFGAFAIGLVAHTVAVALLLWQAKRVGIDRYYRPAAIRPSAPPPVTTGWPPAPSGPAVGSAPGR